MRLETDFKMLAQTERRLCFCTAVAVSYQNVKYFMSRLFRPCCTSSYQFTDVAGELRLTIAGQLMVDSEVGWHKTSRGNSIAYVYIRSGRPAGMGLIFSNGNTGDIGFKYDTLKTLAQELGCDVLSYDYSGYGLSTGKPSEADLYADAAAAVEVMRYRYGWQYRDILLYGFSLGTVACVYLAAAGRRPPDFAGVVLQSPLASVGQRVWSGLRRFPFVDRYFNSTQRIHRVSRPVLIIHDIDDRVIPVWHGVLLHRLCSTAVPLALTCGYGHGVPLSEILMILKAFVAEITRNGACSRVCSSADEST